MAPHAIMPRSPMPERTRELVTRFLAQQHEARTAPRTLSPFDAILPGPSDE